MTAQTVRSAVFDGEIVAINADGVPDFEAIQPRINLAKPGEVARAAAATAVFYYVFDLLYLDGYDLLRVPLAERKALLRRALEPAAHLIYIEHERDDGEALYEAASKLGFEGMVAKRGTSVYEPGMRSGAWLKIKNVLEQEFVVGGFTEGEGSRSKTFGGLLIGYYEGDHLQFASSVGSGLTDAMLVDIRKRLTKIQTDASPFAGPRRRSAGAGVGKRAALLLGQARACGAGAVRRVDARGRFARAGVQGPALRHRPAQRAPRRARVAGDRRGGRRRDCGASVIGGADSRVDRRTAGVERGRRTLRSTVAACQSS